MAFPAKDRIFQVEVTTQCNLKCAACHRTQEIEAGRWNNRHIAADVFRALVANARPSDAIMMEGIGEPTLHPDLPELISIAHDSGKFPTIMFYSNGLVRGMDYYTDLRRRGHNLLVVSVDSLNQGVADQCRFGTDVEKLKERLPQFYRLYQGKFKVSIVLSKKNLFDVFDTLKFLNGIGPMIVHIQGVIATRADLIDGFLPDEETLIAFLRTLSLMKKLYPNLHIGLSGELMTIAANYDAAQRAATPVAVSQDNALPAEIPPPLPAAQPAASARPRCDKPYQDRYVTVDGYMTPCCVIVDSDEWGRTQLDQPLEALLATNSVIVQWFKTYESSGIRHCDTCSLNPSPRAAVSPERG